LGVYREKSGTAFVEGRNYARNYSSVVTARRRGSLKRRRENGQPLGDGKPRRSVRVFFVLVTFQGRSERKKKKMEGLKGKGIFGKEKKKKRTRKKSFATWPQWKGPERQGIKILTINALQDKEKDGKKGRKSTHSIFQRGVEKPDYYTEKHEFTSSCMKGGRERPNRLGGAELVMTKEQVEKQFVSSKKCRCGTTLNTKRQPGSSRNNIFAMEDREKRQVSLLFNV